MTDKREIPIAPEDEPSAEELAEAQVMRPLEDLPSPWTVKGNPRMIEETTLKALSPEDQKVVREAAGSSDPEAIQTALHGFLRKRSVEFRIKAGAGDGATAVEREALEQMNRLRLYSEECGRLEAELAEVVDARIEKDANGDPVAIPVYALQGSLRTSRENRMRELAAAMTQLAGVEGEAALSAAARTEALNRRKIKTELEDRQEVARRARELAREKRINDAAEAKARHL